MWLLKIIFQETAIATKLFVKQNRSNRAEKNSGRLNGNAIGVFYLPIRGLG